MAVRMHGRSMMIFVLILLVVGSRQSVEEFEIIHKLAEVEEEGKEAEEGEGDKVNGE